MANTLDHSAIRKLEKLIDKRWKAAELFQIANEAQRLRERLQKIKNDFNTPVINGWENNLAEMHGLLEWAGFQLLEDINEAIIDRKEESNGE